MTGPATAPAYTTADLLEKLRSRFAWPEYALLEEVGFGGDGAFGNRYSRADAIAIGQWHSAGFGLQGFEVKCSRADWMREIRTIGKADAAYRHCSRFWLVAPEGVATVEELPGTWGWMVPRGSTLRVKRQAPVLQPEPLSPGMISHLVGVAIRRNSSERTMATRIHDEYQRGLEAGREEERRKYRPEALEALRKTVDRFEAESGVTISGEWTSGDIGKAVRFVKNGGMKRVQEKLQRAAAAHLEALQALGGVVDEVETRPYSGKRASLRAMLEAAEMEPGEDRGYFG